jgi:hypothetical protein
MKSALLAFHLVLSCAHASSTGREEQFVCAVAKEGLQQGYLCDVGPLEFHFKDKTSWFGDTTMTCAESRHIVRTGIPSFKALPGENVVFVYNQYEMGKGLTRFTYMTYCAGSKIEGQFTWNAATAQSSDWKVATVTK